MTFKRSGTDGQGAHVLPSLKGLLHRRGLLLIIPFLLAIALVVGVLPKGASKASVRYNEVAVSPQGQVASSNSGGVCK
ncbi:hypothetical protein, partial [Frankia sp. Cr1]|uniref:hypothetical protein n=1 Tax=Frankia sp. Cr1 TaxID=3073931 RepID=UPI002AD558AE